MGFFATSFCSKSIHQHRSLPLPPHIRETDSVTVLLDHDLLVGIFYGGTAIKISSETLTTGGHSTTYQISEVDQVRKIRFKSDGVTTTLYDSFGAGFHLIMSWYVALPEAFQDDPAIASTFSKETYVANTTLSLHERNELSGFRPMMSMLNVHMQDTISVKARGIAAVIELRVRDPSLTTDQLVQDTVAQIKAAEEAYRGKNELVTR